MSGLINRLELSNPPRSLTKISLARGARLLAETDPDLGAIYDRLGEPEMWGRQPGFPTLIRIILEQQVSLATAQTMYVKLKNHLGVVTPQTVFNIQVSGLRNLGLTRQKAGYCHGLATRIHNGDLDLASVAQASDETGRQLLLAVPGLGPWSVDVYYLMALRRPDIWPQGDLALAITLQEMKQLNARPTNEEQQRIAKKWAPWRSVAARFLWMHYLAKRDRCHI